MRNDKIKTLKELEKIIKFIRFYGYNKIVWTNGCFDLFHITHLKLLQLCKKKGDILVVGINSNASVKRLKGINRPINNLKNRAEVIAGLTCVDYVISFKDISPKKILDIIKPDIYIKGGDYTIDTINQEERKIIESYGGVVDVIKTSTKFSTSKLIDKIRKSILYEDGKSKCR